MYQALLIGCGNIGAGYDLDTNQVITHAKAYSQHPDFNLTVFDPNKELESKIASFYNAKTIQQTEESTLKQFDCISICSPTDTHASLLSMALNIKIPVIICEKPVSNKPEELNKLETCYNNGVSKVIVNYIRRFQPAYINLRKNIGQILEKEKLTNVAIRYQRGFINNASHAFDLLQFLFDKSVALEHIQESNRINDHFPNDPTLTLTALWENAGFNVMGLTNVHFSHFEIDLYFHQHKIMISDAGKTIRICEAPENGTFLQPLSEKNVQHGCIENYMKPVVEHAAFLLKGSFTTDNFLESVKLNQQMLNYIHN